MSGSPKSEHLCYVTNSCNTLKEKGHAVSMFRLLASIEETSFSTYKWAQHFQWKTTHLCKIPEFFYVILTLFREKLVTKAKNTDERPCRLQITLSQAYIQTDQTVCRWKNQVSFKPRKQADRGNIEKILNFETCCRNQ